MTRCRSVVAIWPETPPSHHVTATSVLDDPPTLYTGASNGSIVSWHLSHSLSSASSQSIKPVAMLCGHTAPIVDLCVCCPRLAPQEGNTDYHGETLSNGASDECALLSVCSDGVMCVWSKGSGHCTRRRKLPPWVGSPSVVQTLPANRRYVCVASCLTDGIHTPEHDFADSAEGIDFTADQESSGRIHPKCTIVVVDSYSLNIVQTVFHGHLSIGPLKFMALFEPVDEIIKHVAVVVDSYGTFQRIPLVKDSKDDKDAENNSHDKPFQVSTATAEKGSCERGPLVSIATCGQVLVLIYKTECIFMLVDNATVIGVISFKNSSLCSSSDCFSPHVTGGMFISSVNVGTSQSRTLDNLTGIKFAIWNDIGSAVIYDISYVDGTLKSESLHEIPAISCPEDVQLLTCFVQLSDYLLRVESIYFHDKDLFLSKPYITIWSLHQQLRDFGRTCRLLGEGDFLIDWAYSSSAKIRPGMLANSSREETAVNDSALQSTDTVQDQEYTDKLYREDLKCRFLPLERIVSSTMVISQKDGFPSGVVFGYHNGEIELVQFKTETHEVDIVNLHQEGESHGAKHLFKGHKGAVLCLATHQIVGTSVERVCSQVLLSGSVDCTVRIWDFESCNPIMVMHHHVGPIRQIILPPLHSDRPWSDCFLTVGEDSCVALVSLETLRAERLFPGHLGCPGKVVWDSVRGYLACLSENCLVTSGAKDTLYIWDVKAGSRERVLRGTAARSMFSNFCRGISVSDGPSHSSNYNSSGSSLLLSFIEDESSLPSLQLGDQFASSGGADSVEHTRSSLGSSTSGSSKCSAGYSDKLPIKCSRPISGVAVLSFALSSLVPCDDLRNNLGNQWRDSASDAHSTMTSSSSTMTSSHGGTVPGDLFLVEKPSDAVEKHQYADTYALWLLRFSLSFLHFWSVDTELDHLLAMEMNVKRYDQVMLAPGLEGDRGSVTLAFPSFSSILQLWKSSSEFCALRSLSMVSLAQSMVSLSHSCSGVSSSLSAFYTRNFAEKALDVKPPSLQLLASFWQDEDEHVRLAARSLFHCAASRAIPPPLCCPRTSDLGETVNSINQVPGKECDHMEKQQNVASSIHTEATSEIQHAPQDGDSEILKWLESYELQDWISCVGGTRQDAMASHIIVAAALAIWYPSLVKPSLAMSVVHPLIKLVMAMNEKYSSTAAELLAEGMESTWKACIGSEIPHLIGDIFFQIECVSGGSANSSPVGSAVPPKIRETLVGVLLPSLALADIPAFLSVVEGLIWSTASDSPVHLVSLKTLIRLMRGSAKNLAQFLIKV